MTVEATDRSGFAWPDPAFPAAVNPLRAEFMVRVVYTPTAPQDFTATITNGAARLVWNKPASDGNAEILHYIVQMSETGTNAPPVWSAPVTVPANALTPPALSDITEECYFLEYDQATGKGHVLIFAKNFSAYAFARTPSTPTTPPGPGPGVVPPGFEGGGGGGQGGSAATGPAITTDPGNPGADGEDYMHIAYIRGYPDGTVKPDGYLTRAETAMIFWRLDKSADKNTAAPAKFPDVKTGSWYAQAANYLAAKGVLKGEPDGTYRPDNKITRAELTAIVERASGDPKTGANPFADLKTTHWVYSNILSGAAKGWLEGYPDGTFQPESEITRAEAAKLINAWLDRRRFADDFIQKHPPLYPDLGVAHWAYKDLIEASYAHDYAYDAKGQEEWQTKTPLKQ